MPVDQVHRPALHFGALLRDLHPGRRPLPKSLPLDKANLKGAVQNAYRRAANVGLKAAPKAQENALGRGDEEMGMHSNGLLVSLVASSFCGARVALRRRFRRRLTRLAVPSLTATAPTVPRAVNVAERYSDLSQKSNIAARMLSSLPAAVPIPLLSVYTVLPAMSLLAATLCPSTTRLARGLAAALGCLAGTVAGSFLEQAKKDAASCSLAKLLSQHLQEAVSVDDLRSLIQKVRRRFGVPVASTRSEVWEDGALCTIYETLLNSLLEGPENDPGDLPSLQRLKSALEIDGIVVGNAHRHAAQLLISKGYSGLEGEPMRVATDKLLFLSERAFSDEASEEAGRYEMRRVRDVLNISEKEALARIASVSRALYQQNLSAVVDKVDAHTGEALAGAQTAFGLASNEAERMNADTYRQLATEQLSSGLLSPESKVLLERAQSVLQLSDRAALATFAAVAGPCLRKDVEEVASGLTGQASTATADQLKANAEKLSTRGKELGLSAQDTFNCVRKDLLEMLRSQYNAACKDARINGTEKAVQTLDQLIAFAKATNVMLGYISAAAPTDVEASEQDLLLSVSAEPLSARRLYGIYLERSLSGPAPAGSPPEELAQVLELSQEDEEIARVETCQPLLRKLFEDTLAKAEASNTTPLQLKPEINPKIAAFNLPSEAIQETAVEVYKTSLAKFEGRVLKAAEAESLGNARDFLDIEETTLKRLHLKAFSQTYMDSVDEAMGRTGIMSPEAMEALHQLRERLGLDEDSAEKLLHSAAEDRLREFMIPVRDAWEEATYTKEALVQLNKERGKDIGDDPMADGTGGELGIKGEPQLESGVRGFKLMGELCKVADFYTINKIVKEDAPEEERYPVTVGKMIEEKNKEEIYRIFAWNAVTCQDTASRERWARAKPTVGGLLGLSPKQQEKAFVGMVSRWASMFIKNKIEEQGTLKKDDISMLTDWAPTFFGIKKEVTDDIVKTTNKGILQGKVLRLLNAPTVTPEDLSKLRAEVDEWGLLISKDLELSRPQLRCLFRVEVSALLEDPDLSDDQKVDGVESSRETFGLGEKEAMEEMHDLIKSRCRACLVNALGDQMQENLDGAVEEMRKLEHLAAFGVSAGLDLNQDWEIAPAMRQKLMKTYVAGAKGRTPDVKMLERVLAA
eukprot:TRINITY_DN57388_c0_g1_i1.p1 TRINITY_DN57388_c0_g1~~TRINITY_DN57388_c0_g1_i1.p1  ORF type:complete len:1170 (+),score=273.72 TRINITY_DN57388_c0_g1_i1:67-3510(+)